MLKKLAIVHYLPLEYYPPVTNLIDYLAYERKNEFDKISIYSSHNVKGRKKYQVSSSKYQDAGLKINRSPFPNEKDNSLIRLFEYLHFNLCTLIGLLKLTPNVILYYESYSVLPVYIYTKIFNRKCKVFIHNHEYASKDWYDSTMKLVKYYHKLEKKCLYPRAEWISQTNADRLHFFQQDHPHLRKEQLRVMPNYPPSGWRKTLQVSNQQSTTPTKLIYVGSLSFEDTYLKELCEWVVAQKGNILFDVYAYNLYEDVKTYFKALDSPWVNFFEQGIEYNKQPQLLSRYHVGLILYKAHNQNYTYNAPNKLFEYLACDLDVWYPDVLQGPLPYNTTDSYPKVIPIDFENMGLFDWQKARDKEGLKYKASEFFCEEVYQTFVDELVKQDKKRNRIKGTAKKTLRK